MSLKVLGALELHPGTTAPIPVTMVNAKALPVIKQPDYSRRLEIARMK